MSSCNRPDCRFCSTLRNIVLTLFECMALMHSASQSTLGTFIRLKQFKAWVRNVMKDYGWTATSLVVFVISS